MHNETIELDDDLNPIYLLQGIASVLLGQIVKGEIDVVLLAKKELAARGIDENRKEIGYKKAIEHFGLTD